MFKTGDIVQLKCGGVKMVVNFVTPGNTPILPMISCIWHDRYGHEQRGVYPPNVLKLLWSDR